MTQLKALPVLLPGKAQQEQYLERVGKVLNLKEEALLSEMLIDDLFVTLQSRAFSGQV